MVVDVDRSATRADAVPDGGVTPYQIFILALSLYALGALSVEFLFPVGPDIRHILEVSDTAVCVLFFIDFLYQLVRANNRWSYFRRWGWLDLLSSVPEQERGVNLPRGPHARSGSETKKRR